jgi:hypothetical protein
MARGLAELLEVGQMRVHGGRRGEAHGLADVAHRRRIAVLRGVALDEVEDLLLALGQIDHLEGSSASRVER